VRFPRKEVEIEMTSFASRRALLTLLAAGVAGALLWVAGRVGRGTIGGYWEAMLLVGAAGLVFGLAQLRGRSGNPLLHFVLTFLPVLVVAAWVIVAMQPHGTTTRAHVLSWSSDLGIVDVVRTVGTWVGVLAFGVGYTLGLALEPAPRVAREPVVEPGAADAPVAAERREVEDTRVVPRRHSVPR
jgi:hypothetical protein